MGLFSTSPEEKARKEALAKEARAKELAKLTEQRKKKEEQERKEKIAKHNNELTKAGINAKDVDPSNYQAVLIEQNNVMMMYLENIAIMNSNILNNPILAAAKSLRNKQLARYHKDYQDPND